MNLLTVKDRMNERLAKVTSAAKNFKVRDKLKTKNGHEWRGNI